MSGGYKLNFSSLTRQLPPPVKIHPAHQYYTRHLFSWSFPSSISWIQGLFHGLFLGLDSEPFGKCDLECNLLLLYLMLMSWTHVRLNEGERAVLCISWWVKDWILPLSRNLRRLFSPTSKSRNVLKPLQVQGVTSFIMVYIESMYHHGFSSLSHLLFCFDEDAATYILINMWLKWVSSWWVFNFFFFTLLRLNIYRANKGLKIKCQRY